MDGSLVWKSTHGLCALGHASLITTTTVLLMVFVIPGSSDEEESQEDPDIERALIPGALVMVSQVSL